MLYNFEVLKFKRNFSFSFFNSNISVTILDRDALFEKYIQTCSFLGKRVSLLVKFSNNNFYIEFKNKMLGLNGKFETSFPPVHYKD